jgi:glycosyltransferase involved in cell wall biosynthesis
MKTLYLCYFGLREPLVQTQVLPYLRQLGASGIEVALLTFEPEPPAAWPVGKMEEWQSRLQSEGIRWLFLPYHKRPSLPATVYDIVRGAWTAARLVRRQGVQVLHARAHVPLAMALLAQKMSRGCRLIFDLRGLMAEEYADAGIWTPGSTPFRVIKWLEKVGLRRADQIVVLTRRMKEWLIEQAAAAQDKIEVIPCCVDFERFAERDGEQLSEQTNRLEVVYAGSVTGLYLLEEMARFFLALRACRPDAFLRILTKSAADEASGVLRRAGIEAKDFQVSAAAPDEVPEFFRRARLGLSFRKATFSQIASSPTKIPEYLACGLVVVSNSGIGDTDNLLERERVGVVVKGFNAEEYERAAAAALLLMDDPETPPRCVRVARERFDLVAVGGVGYGNVYRRIEKQNAPTQNMMSNVSE